MLPSVCHFQAQDAQVVGLCFSLWLCSIVSDVSESKPDPHTFSKAWISARACSSLKAHSFVMLELVELECY